MRLGQPLRLRDFLGSIRLLAKFHRFIVKQIFTGLYKGKINKSIEGLCRLKGNAEEIWDHKGLPWKQAPRKITQNKATLC